MMTAWSGQSPVIGVVGATGAVGREMVAILLERGVSPERIRAFASERSAGRALPCGDAGSLVVETLEAGTFAGLDVAMLAIGADAARTAAIEARDAGCVVIDNSSAFRDDPEVPLVIPEINGVRLEDCPGPCIIANPNCSTILAMMVIEPIHRAVGVRRVSIATYQAVSGAGMAAMDELEQQARDHVAGQPLRAEALPSPALFNVFPHESTIDATGFNLEERKLRSEGRRILGTPELPIAATCMRVGTRAAMAISRTRLRTRCGTGQDAPRGSTGAGARRGAGGPTRGEPGRGPRGADQEPPRSTR